MLAATIDRFELQRWVGAGGFGEVYAARDCSTGSLVALKLLTETAPDAIRWFEREASVLSELHHPCVVRYVAHGQTQAGQRYLAMEWLDGVTLEDRLRKGRLSVREALVLVSRVVHGLAAAALLGVVHRDIKPANLFLVGSDVERCKILDFGVARRMGDSQLVTRTGMVIGTALYMSPEQARGDSCVDGRSDIFSLGNVLYECLSGTAPFEGPNQLVTLGRVCFEEPFRIEKVRPGVPPRLAALVHAMLAKAPGSRPSYKTIQDECAAIGADDIGRAGTLATGDSLLPPSGSDATIAASSRPSLRPGAEQRILCVVFVGRIPRDEATSEADVKMLMDQLGARCERLLDGSRIAVMDQARAPGEQGLAAAHAALALRRLFPSAPIAICTGRAILDGQLPYGDVFERGALLVAEAPWGAIWLDETSAGFLDARFEVVRKGTWLALERERVGGELPRTLLGQVTPFVGREREIGQLALLYNTTAEGSTPQAALVLGAAGAGKSRLRYEFVQRMHAGGERFTLLAGTSDPVRSHTPFGLLGSAMRAHARIAHGDALDMKREKMQRCIGKRVRPEQATELAAFIGELSGVPFPDDQLPGLRAARRDPQLMADRLRSSFLEWLECEAKNAPVLFVAEDVQWADAASVRFLDAALGNLEDLPLMVLGLARPEVRDSFPQLWSERNLLTIKLAKLPGKACEQLLDAVAGDVLTDAETRAWLVERAEGNPFFLEELVRSLRANERLLPDTILGVIQARLDALGNEAKQVLRAGSIFGFKFREAGVSELLGEAHRVDVTSCLRLLMDRELVFTEGQSREPEYVFRHALIRDAAYALLPDEERSVGHRLAGAWLETSGAFEPTVLANHFELGGNFQRAAHWYAASATQALDASSLDDVVRWGDKALSCGLKGEAVGAVAAAVAEALSYGGDDLSAVEWAEVARENVSPDTPAWWRASQIAAIVSLRQNTPELREIAEEMIDHTSGVTWLPEQVIALSLLAGESFRLLQHELAARFLNILPVVFSDELRGRPEGWVHVARATVALANDLGQAAEQARAALFAFRQSGATRDVAMMLSFTAYILFELGADQEAEALYTEFVPLVRQLGAKQWVCNGEQNLGLIYLRRGQPAEAEGLLERSAEGYAQVEMCADQAVSLFWLALARAQCGDLDGGFELVRRALEVGGSEPAAVAGAHSVLARLELLRGHPERALQASERAIQQLTAHHLFENVAMMRLTHIESLLACGREQEGRCAVADARQWLEERAGKIADPVLRQSIFSKVPENARILELSRVWFGSPEQHLQTG